MKRPGCRVAAENRARSANPLRVAARRRSRALAAGADHPDTLSSRHNLAYAYESAGDLGRAIPLYEQTLADRLRVLGADHPETEALRVSLAAARQYPQ